MLFIFNNHKWAQAIGEASNKNEIKFNLESHLKYMFLICISQDFVAKIQKKDKLTLYSRLHFYPFGLLRGKIGLCIFFSHFNRGGIQVNLCQKLLFLHQLTHNMTTDCSLFIKIISSEYLSNILCAQIVVLFWYS